MSFNLVTIRRENVCTWVIEFSVFYPDASDQSQKFNSDRLHIALRSPYIIIAEASASSE